MKSAWMYVENSILLILFNTKIVIININPMSKAPKSEELTPSGYYHTLEHALKILFKKEAMWRLGWSSMTFHRRMKEEDYKPGELLILEEVITDKTYMQHV
jgi:hypothetical protein